MNDRIVIDFKDFQGPVYSGRERAELLRAELKLDAIDNSDQFVTVKIPETTYSVTSSFFLGLFSDSVIKAGTRDKFFSKFNFEAPDYVMEDLEGYIVRALAKNFSF